MPMLADVLRQFWLRGLNDVSQPQLNDLSSWFSAERYQVYHPITSSSFTLSFSNADQLLDAIAADCRRMASASFESISGVSRDETFPKSTAWQVIQTYYSAFFAAHAIVRMVGTSCTQLEIGPAKSIYKISDVFGQSGSITTLEQGFYICECQLGSNQVVCNKGVGRGVHEAFWTVFNSRIKWLSTEILVRGTMPSIDQLVSNKLDELSKNLCTGQFNNGSWLSAIRNQVNYKHQLSTWFPYRDQKSYYDKLYNAKDEWKTDPTSITLSYPAVNEIQRFHATCHFIISMCREMVTDMAQRSSGRRSFLEDEAMSLLRRIKV